VTKSKQGEGKKKNSGGGTVHGGVGVEAMNLGDERGLGDVLGEVDVDGADADLGARLALHVHVRLRVLPAPHDDHGQPRHLRASERASERERDSTASAHSPRSKNSQEAVRGGVRVLTSPWAEESAATSAATSRRMSAAMALPSMICAIAVAGRGSGGGDDSG